MVKLIVHAGFPKCGSTSVFSALKANLDTLVAHDILVFNRNFNLPADPGKLMPPLWELQDALKEPAKSEAMRDSIIRNIAKSPANARLILSSENLSQPPMAKMLAGMERHCEVELIFYFRPQTEWIPSAWKQWNLKEGFTPSETAQILGSDVPSVESLISEAQSDIDAELATDVLIIEDEAIISADIENLVKDLGHRVTATATTHDEAVDAVSRHKPGLVLADIQLADGSSGIDAVKDILKAIDVPVIFITAFPERLLTGERPEPTFLITKPFQPETVKAAISQALFFHPGRREIA